MELGNKSQPLGVEDGRYYIHIKANTHSSLSLVVTEKPVDSSTDPNNMIIRTLHQSEYVSDIINRSSDSRYYSFEMTLGENVPGINLNLIPKRGSFILAVSNNE